MIFVDSSVWIDWFGGGAAREVDYLDRCLGQNDVLVGDLVLTEVLQGIANAAQFERARARLLALPLVEVAGADVAVQAAHNHRALRRLGITPRKTIDTLIATRCIAEDWPLLTRDRDFRPFADHLGLQLVTG